MNEITVRETAIQPVMNLASFIPEWLHDLEKRVDAQEISQDTADGYERGVLRFMSDRVTGTADSIRDWKAALLATYKPASVNAWLSGVKSFFTWLAEKQEIPFNPTQAIKGAKRKGSNNRQNADHQRDVQHVLVGSRKVELYVGFAGKCGCRHNQRK